MAAQNNPDETMEKSNLEIEQHLLHVIAFHASLMMLTMMVMMTMTTTMMMMDVVWCVNLNVAPESTLSLTDSTEHLFDEGVGQALPFCPLHVHQLLISENQHEFLNNSFI